MRKTARLWTTSIAAAALVALPMIATAQTYPPAGQTTSSQSNPSQASSADQNSPQFHLDKAKKVLDSISTSDLTGTALSQISQIKTQFTALYNDYTNKSGEQVGTSGTTPPPPSSASSMAPDWKSQFNSIESSLDRLNIPKSSYAPAATGGAGVSGTTGSTGAGESVTLPPDVRDKLTEFRMHLEQFYSLAKQ